MTEGRETLMFPVRVTVSQRFPTGRFATTWVAAAARRAIVGKGTQALIVNDVSLTCNAFILASEDPRAHVLHFRLLAQDRRFPTARPAPIFDDPLFEVMSKKIIFEEEAIGTDGVSSSSRYFTS